MLSLAQWMTAQIDDFMRAADELLPPHRNVPARRRILGAPASGQDPYNAIIRLTDIEAERESRSSALLEGKRVALKDLICVAGVPLTAATNLFDEYVPDVDSVIVDRILRAGGRITAMTNMEGMAFGGGGESGCFGPTLNPFDTGRSTSGSSGGSAAALFYDDIDIAFGTDQGGSIRQPASWCGVVGLKPTHGLVPYAGILSHDPTIDHVGPMARSVADVALAMEAVAGSSPDDPRQAGIPESLDGFVDAVLHARGDLSGIRLGVLQEATAHDGTPERAAVLEAFGACLEEASRLGASVSTVSIPEHRAAGPMMFAVMAEGMAATLHGYGQAYHLQGSYSVSMRQAFGRGLAARGGELPPAYRAAVAVGEHLRTSRYGAVYATAREVARVLTAAYDRALSGVDFLIMPTTPGVAMPLSTGLSMLETQLRSFSMGSSMAADTPAHNLTGHPALSIPASEVNGLPSGIMLVGSRLDDRRLLAVARSWEIAVGWRPTDVPDPGPGQVRVSSHAGE